jgi:hypothetical protein
MLVTMNLNYVRPAKALPFLVAAHFGKILILKPEVIFLPFILLALMMITAGSLYLVFADPLHCDQQGYPSCYSVGYNDGQANPGTNCPSGHSDNFCAGWQAGASLAKQANPNTTSNVPGSNTTYHNHPSIVPPTTDSWLHLLYLLSLLLLQ